MIHKTHTILEFLRNSFNERCRAYISQKRKTQRKVFKSRYFVAFAFEPLIDVIGINGCPEREELDATLKKLKQINSNFDLALDIGANVGTFTLRLAEQYNNVISFEPHPITFKILSINCEYNKFSTKISLQNFACSSSSGVALLNDWHPNHSGMARPNPLNYQVQHENDANVIYECKTDTLDNFLSTAQKKRVSLIKLDVEGHEVDVLQGAMGLIKSSYPPICYEDWETKGGVKSELMKYLEGIGYNEFLVLETLPKQLFSSTGFIHKILNKVYKIFYIALFGQTLVLEKCDYSRRHGYEHILALKTDA